MTKETSSTRRSRHRRARSLRRDGRHRGGAGGDQQGNDLPPLGLARAADPRRALVARGTVRRDGRRLAARGSHRPALAPRRVLQPARHRPRLRVVHRRRRPRSRARGAPPSRRCGAPRASFEQVVRRGIERGELPADVDVDLFIDVVRSPFIYRRVVAQSPVQTADIEPVLDLVLGAFSPGTQLRGSTHACST